ncbi:MAG: GWxTD domain-containing protein [Balneolaceae bacterium]
MHLLQKYIQIVVSVLAVLFIAEVLNAQPQRAYERGLEAVYRGDITQALDEWYSAYEQDGSIDSRIGLEFIRVVTEEEMEEYYGHATELYYRALADGIDRTSRLAIRQEVERMRPLIGEGMYRQWQTWWEENRRKLASDMRGFWVQLDPTPAKLANERLIEHWERINTARQEFTRNGSTVYGTDERALIFIRYGEPDRTESGILTLQSFNIHSWLENQFNPQSPRSGSLSGEIEEIDWERSNRLENAIYEYHQYPEYEIWFYDRIASGTENPVPFLFGTDIRTGEFSLQNSIEDFIPERAYYPDRLEDEETREFTRVGITPALMLQMLYYEQLVQVDSFFENRFRNLRERVLEQGLQALQGMDLDFANKSRELIQQQVNRAPKERSTYSRQLPEIPLQIHHYRFLNDSLAPSVITYIESFPQEAFLIDYYRNREVINTGITVQPGQNVSEMITDYELVHHLQTYDEDWNVVESKQQERPLILARTASGAVSASVYQQLHPVRANQSASVELLNYNPETRAVYDTPFPAELRGLNRVQYRQPEPLENITDSLEVADLVLGYQREEQTTEPFSFWVANDQIIPYGETLMLHIEVYNLKRQPNSFTQFELTYRILPVDESGNVNQDQTEFILTLNFINEDQSVTEDLEIETAELQMGLYELRVRVEDTVTDRVKERLIRFEVEE